MIGGEVWQERLINSPYAPNHDSLPKEHRDNVSDSEGSLGQL